VTAQTDPLPDPRRRADSAPATHELDRLVGAVAADYGHVGGGQDVTHLLGDGSEYRGRWRSPRDQCRHAPQRGLLGRQAVRLQGRLP
jgi:hypothetical protein